MAKKNEQAQAEAPAYKRRVEIFLPGVPQSALTPADIEEHWEHNPLYPGTPFEGVLEAEAPALAEDAPVEAAPAQEVEAEPAL